MSIPADILGVKRSFQLFHIIDAIVLCIYLSATLPLQYMGHCLAPVDLFSSNHMDYYLSYLRYSIRNSHHVDMKTTWGLTAYWIMLRNSSSERIRTPNFCAFSSFAGPMFSPARTKEVFFEMLPTFLPPCCSMSALYSSREWWAKTPLMTML